MNLTRRTFWTALVAPLAAAAALVRRKPAPHPLADRPCVCVTEELSREEFHRRYIAPAVEHQLAKFERDYCMPACYQRAVEYGLAAEILAGRAELWPWTSPRVYQLLGLEAPARV